MSMPFYTRRLLVLVTLLLSVLASEKVHAATWYIDAKTGDDTAGNGSESKPFKTWPKVRPLIKSGDTVYLEDGDYGSMIEGEGPKNVFSSWVEVRARPGATPVFTSARFGANGSQYTNPRLIGSFDVYLRFIGVRFANGVSIYGGRNLELVKCEINAIPPLGGPGVTGVTGFYIQSATDIKIVECTIDRVSAGIALAFVNRCLIKDSIIRNVFADGITVSSSQNCAIVGNTIYNLDDGIDDGDPEGKGWNIHNDAIQIQIWGGPKETLITSKNILIRGNKIYGSDGQGIQFNNYLQTGPEIHNSDIIIENNIFGPTRAYTINSADATDRLIARHNTFIGGTYSFSNPGAYTKNGATAPRTTTSNITAFRVSSGNSVQGPATGGAVYNNIFSRFLESPASAEFCNNIITDDATTTAFPRTVIIAPDEQIFNKTKDINAITLSQSSPAKHFGTILATTPSEPAWYLTLLQEYQLGRSSVLEDAFGIARDIRPDAGAFEAPGEVVESPKTYVPLGDEKHVWLDDFEDASPSRDWYLEGAGILGVSWTKASIANINFKFVRNDNDGRNWFSSDTSTGVAFSYINEAPNLPSFKIEFDANNAFTKANEGLAFCIVDEANYYFLDIARDTGILYRVKDGQRTQIAASAAIRLPHSGKKLYRVTVEQKSTSLTILVDVNRDGSIELQANDIILPVFQNQRTSLMGFYRNVTDNAYTRVSYDNLAIFDTLEGVIAPAAPILTIQIE